MRSEYTPISLWLHDVHIGEVLANGVGRFEIQINHAPEFESIFAALSREGKAYDGIRLELFNKELEPCQAEKLTWDHFQPGQMDNFVMTCDLTGPHRKHKNSHTGATWEDPAVSSGKNDNPNVSVGADEINNRLGSHIATSEAIPKHKIIRSHFASLMDVLDHILPPGREKDIAMEKLETAAMWANKAVTADLPLAEEVLYQKAIEDAQQGSVVFYGAAEMREMFRRMGLSDENIEIAVERTTGIKSQARTREEAQYQAGLNAFHAYQNRNPDVG